MKKFIIDGDAKKSDSFIKRAITKRILAFSLIIVFLSPLAICFVIFCIANTTHVISDKNNGKFVAEKIENELAVQGCFYDKAANKYVFPGLTFGKGLDETIEDLGLQDWYTDARRQETQRWFAECERDNSMMFTPNNYVNVNAFDSVYSLYYDFTQYKKCFDVYMRANIFISDYHPKGIYVYDNIMTYNEACRYFSDMYSDFTEAYGTPQKESFTVDFQNLTLENYDMQANGRENYAYWILGDEGNRSALQLTGKVYILQDEKGNDYLIMQICIAVENEIEGVSFDDATLIHPTIYFNSDK